MQSKLIKKASMYKAQDNFEIIFFNLSNVIVVMDVSCMCFWYSISYLTYKLIEYSSI